MTARLILNGREAHPFHLLNLEIDAICDCLWDFPKDHPDLKMHLDRLDVLTLEMLKMRRAN